MPSVHNRGRHSYKLVEDKNDGLGKVPAFDEEAFQLGIMFKAKYVGTLEITRPTCRAEIVTAMRKVRYEFKIKGIEKRRVNITISVEGIKVAVRRRRRRMRKERPLDEEQVILHEHPIGRIFYVSHDSMDLKIFSYITKDNFDNQFRCSVFKAYRKSKALFVVRTIGQAFEVCHRLQQENVDKKEDKEDKVDGQKVDAKVLADSGTDIDAVDLEKTPKDEQEDGGEVSEKINMKPIATLFDISNILSPVGSDGKSPMTIEQLRVLFNQQLEHYMQESEMYKAENTLLKDQLALERNARNEAQEREHLSMQKNRELLHTIQVLTTRLPNGSTSGVDSFNSTLKYSDTTFAQNHSTMFSPPRKGNCLIDLNGFSSVINSNVPLNSDNPSTMGRVAPLARMDNSVDGLQTTIGLHWKTFDEDDGPALPGNGSDESTSDSSEDDDTNDFNAPGQVVPTEKTNGFNDVKMVNGKGPHVQSNGTIWNSMQTENNNLTKTNEVRSAIQTDF